jgi:flavin-binding protein dodecin
VSVAKIIELTATSPDSFEDTCKQGIAKAGETVRNIQSAWVDGQEVILDNG